MRRAAAPTVPQSPLASIKNPYLKKNVDATKTLIYG